MGSKNPDMMCFSSIQLTEPVIQKNTVKSNIILNKISGDESKFILRLKYEENLNNDFLPLLRLAFCMPLLNYGLFTKQFKLNFSISESDLVLLNELNKVFSRDIFVNKILRRRTSYILPDFLPDEKKVKPHDADSKAVFKATKIIPDKLIAKSMDKNSCGVLSSGGKESLLTYGMLKEIGCKVYPLYINESGGHWRTALTAYDYHKKK